MRDDILFIERDGQYRRQAAEHLARQRSLAELANPRSRTSLQVRARLAGLLNAAARRASRSLSRPSKPQEQCC